MLTIHNDKDNNNNNNSDNNGNNEIYIYYNNYGDSSVQTISEIRNDNTNSARKRGICSC